MRRAVEAEIDAKGYGAPCRVLGTTIETDLAFVNMVFPSLPEVDPRAHLVRWLLLQLGEDVVRLCLCSERHDRR